VKNAFPKISIITPSFNQGQYIEDTILSVIQQQYPNIEYVIIDGGSTDNTLDIIKKYEKHITYWISEPDKGQSDAINKGLKYATGDIINWLNSDDYYMPGALRHVASKFSNENISAYCGRSRVFSNANEYISQGTDVYTGNLAKTIGWARIDQPETFFHKKVWDAIIKVNEHFHYVMDKELWIRYLLHFGLDGIAKDDKTLVNFRIHDQSKTGAQVEKFSEETFDLFYSIAESKKLPIAAQLSAVANPKSKEIFGYNATDPDMLLKSINYFLLLVALESYAQNNYPLAKKAASFIDKKLLEKEDITALNKVLFRMKLLPVGAKSIFNKWASR
jgi:glycosyltransferase involved in cell wall biosynthesis